MAPAAARAADAGARLLPDRGFDIANRRWLRGAGHLLIAGAAKPSYVLNRLAARVNLPGIGPVIVGLGADGSRTAEAPAAR
jgi:hypothetical protein